MIGYTQQEIISSLKFPRTKQEIYLSCKANNSSLNSSLSRLIRKGLVTFRKESNGLNYFYLK